MTELLGYLGVLAGAIVPWFELFAIPAGIALGLNPVLVGVLAFAGNASATLATILGWQRLVAWRRRRRRRPAGVASRRDERGRRAFDRFGVPGLALQGPVVTGIYVAAVIALGLGAPRRSVVTWCMISIALWSAALTIGSVAGLSVL